jgi:cell division initiation protein
MYTPVEIQGKTFKGSGMGYSKTDVDTFVADIAKDYQQLYEENVSLKEQVNNLNASLAHYKDIEKSLQKALVLAETTAEETVASAHKNAVVIEQEAVLKAQSIVADAKVELEKIMTQSEDLMKQYENYRAQYKALAKAQIDVLESDAFAFKPMKSMEALEGLEKDAEEHVDELQAGTVSEPVPDAEETGDDVQAEKEEDFDEELSGEDSIIKEFSEIFDDDKETAGDTPEDD